MRKMSKNMGPHSIFPLDKCTAFKRRNFRGFVLYLIIFIAYEIRKI